MKLTLTLIIRKKGGTGWIIEYKNKKGDWEIE